jgi:hypothetical protein
MTARLVTQHEADARLLCKLLGPELSTKVRVYADRIWSDTISGARTSVLLGKPVALVLDAGSRKRLKIAQRRSFLKFALGLVGPSFMWRVILVKPEIPRLYFRDLGVLRQLVGRDVSAEQLARARTQPRQVLAELFGVSMEDLDAELSKRLESVDVSPLAQFPSVRRLRSFVQKHSESRSPPLVLR